jgi:hypothetical protein
MKIRPSLDLWEGTLHRCNVEVLLFAIALIVGLMLLSSCGPLPQIPEIAPPKPADEAGPETEYWDELECFPEDCDLPPGMKELCQAFAAGSISWPEDCAVMPGEACQTLCTQEKAAGGVTIAFEYAEGEVWKAYFTSKR